MLNDPALWVVFFGCMMFGAVGGFVLGAYAYHHYIYSVVEEAEGILTGR